MRRSGVWLAVLLLLSLMGFAHAKEPVEGGRKPAKREKRKAVEDGKEKAAGSEKGEKKSCDTLTGIQELENL